MGDGPTKGKLQEMASYLELSNLTFIDRRPKTDMPHILASLDASLVPLAVPIPYAMPSKVYEAWASGVPPIIANGSECATLVTQKKAGCCYEPGNADDLASVIAMLAEDRELWFSMRGHCKQLAARFDRDVISRRTEAMLRAIAENKPLPPIIW
jgi:glycosyltransferase involved in cell wall biosynthesis